ncbi:MAG: EAL domain-containing protein, partial [Candidatus Limnocylindrales bacterium]
LELAPSHVKLDRALVTGIDHDPARQALATGLVHFAQKIDAMLIAEGVETAAERDTLLGLGIRAGQGFLFGRAVRVEEIASPGSGASRP